MALLPAFFFFLGNREVVLAKRDVLVYIKHELKEHQLITEWVIIGVEDKDATKCKTEVVVLKPKAE